LAILQFSFFLRGALTYILAGRLGFGVFTLKTFFKSTYFDNILRPFNFFKSKIHIYQLFFATKTDYSPDSFNRLICASAPPVLAISKSMAAQTAGIFNTAVSFFNLPAPDFKSIFQLPQGLL
jgi:hypothetical protein